MMTKDFEKYFPLPMTFDEKNSVIEASNGITLAYTSKYLVQGKQARNALKRTWRYAVQCANLMPEAAELLKSADEKLIDLCSTCWNAMDAAGLGRFVDCKNCNVESLDTSIKALLAKLEGGADDEARKGG